jgi:hypothetical protein
MLSNLKGKRLWNIALGIATVLASSFVIVRIALTEELQRFDYAVLFFASVSSAYLIVSLSPRGKVEE